MKTIVAIALVLMGIALSTVALADTSAPVGTCDYPQSYPLTYYFTSASDRQAFVVHAAHSEPRSGQHCQAPLPAARRAQQSSAQAQLIWARIQARQFSVADGKP